MITIDQFRATRRESADLGSEPDIQDESLQSVAGWVYLDCLFIERMANGNVCLRIGNWEEIAPESGLAFVEANLYEWACDEGYCDDDASDLARDPYNPR